MYKNNGGEYVCATCYLYVCLKFAEKKTVISSVTRYVRTKMKEKAGLVVWFGGSDGFLVVIVFNSFFFFSKK